MADYQIGKCPIWNVDCKVLLGSPDLSYVIDSPRTGGKYLVDFELYQQLTHNLFPLTNTSRVLLTTWLVDKRNELEQNEEKEYLVRLQRDVVERAIKGKMKKLSPNERIRRLLFRLADRGERGQWFNVMALWTNITLLAETESINRQDADMLVDRLVELRLLNRRNNEISARIGGLTEVRVSFEGHEVVNGNGSIDMNGMIGQDGTLVVKPIVFRVPKTSLHSEGPPIVAIMMPFQDEYKRVHDVIKNVCDELDLRALRADDMWNDPTIIQDIFALLFESDIVVAELTGSNPNVFYEIGIAHTLGRTVIPITQEINNVPFDTIHHRIVEYRCCEEGLKVLYNKLSNKLSECSPSAHRR